MTVLDRDRKLACKGHERSRATLFGQIGNVLGFGGHGRLCESFDPTRRSIPQVERANVQPAHFREASQGLDQNRGTCTRRSATQAFEVGDPRHASAGQESLQIRSLFRRADLA